MLPKLALPKILSLLVAKYVVKNGPSRTNFGNQTDRAVQWVKSVHQIFHDCGCSLPTVFSASVVWTNTVTLINLHTFPCSYIVSSPDKTFRSCSAHINFVDGGWGAPMVWKLLVCKQEAQSSFSIRLVIQVVRWLTWTNFLSCSWTSTYM